MSYTAPLDDITFTLDHLSGYRRVSQLPGLEDSETVNAILHEAARFASDVIAPLNRIGDKTGAQLTPQGVVTPPGWQAAYAAFTAGGWNGVQAPAEFGGLGLPMAVNAAIQEMMQGACVAFSLCPVLTQGAIEALNLYASPALKAAYLPNLISGRWTGTMNLTEAQAGSDLSAIRTRAAPDGAQYRIRGQKIFISYGDHDLTENTVHLVLARLPDAPEGVKGISLFAVPKFLAGPDGAPGARNDVVCASIEHKLGIHASPTCTMIYGEGEGALGDLIGEPHRGLEYMFVMMNAARLFVGLQGIGLAGRAYQAALAFAQQRRQGRAAGASAASPIIAHPDVQRMLGLMKTRIDAARAIAYHAAAALDLAARLPDAAERARFRRRGELLIPVVKGWSTEMAVDVASLALQVHGGMGYIEETGPAQLLRDARILTIYEGTTGIQALDLVGRKIIRDSGLAARELAAEIRQSAGQTNAEFAGYLAEAAGLIEGAADWLVKAATPDLPAAAAVHTLHLFGLATGCWMMIEAAAHDPSRQAAAQFYCTQVFPEAAARYRALTAGSAHVAPMFA